MPAHLLRRPSLVPAAHRLGVAAAAAWRAGGALSPPLARSSSSQRTCAPSTAGSTSAGSDTSTAETLRALARSRIAAAAPHPPLAPLEDRHARQHTYLRISLTERCNLRCTYCMPAEGLADLTPRAELLTPHELQRLATLFVRQGVDKIRLTGGEPTVRRDIVDVVARLASLRSEGLLQLGMTSNGMLLPRLLPSLAAAGLTHLNISLDTLDPHLFELITRRSGAGVARVLAAAEQSVKLGLTTKLNVVVVRGVNDSKDVLDFVEWARHRDIVVRFIEYMPFDGNKWRPEKLVPYRVLLERIVERFGPLEKVGDTANDTSKHWRVPGSRGTIGFITSMTDHFCGTCNRLRITADGNLKVCLFGNTEVSLRDAMRTGLPLELSGVAQTDGPASDEDLLHIVSAAVKRKHAKHAGEPRPAPQVVRHAARSSSLVAPSGTLSHLRRATSGTLRRTMCRSKVPLHLLQGAAGSTALRFYSSRQGWDPWDLDGDGGPWGSLDAQADAPADQQAAARMSSSRSAQASASTTPPRSAQSWSSYMGDSDGEDSPWASLDAIADGAEHLAVPFSPSHSPDPPSTRPPSSPHSPLQSEPRVVHNTASSPSRPQDAFRQQAARPPPSSAAPAARLTHVDPGSGEASMVDVSAKASTSRSATASARVYIPASVVPLIRASSDSSTVAPAAPEAWRNKGPVLHTAQLAGIMAAKRTADLIPLCHPLALSHVEVVLEVVEPALSSSQPDLSGLPGQSTDGGFGLDALGADEAWDEPSSSPEERAWIAKQLAEIDGGHETAPSASAEPQEGSAGEAYISVRCTARTSGPTGVEMEALTGASVACLTLWDMLKSVGGRTMRIDGLCVTAKSGGKSGDWTRSSE